jgi:hypothetical protein
MAATQVSQHSLVHLAGFCLVPRVSHVPTGPPHVALTQASHACCALSIGISQQPEQTLHGSASLFATQR